MHKFVRSLITEWRRLGLPVAGETVLVAVSGGADSVSLLLALAELRKRKKLDLGLVTAHYNHNLRPDSAADEVFVKDLASELGLEQRFGKMRPPGKGNLEEFARRERYRFLEKAAAKEKAFAIVTAHTKNDQAETFLMNLIRGSGPAGLAAMPAKREMGSGTKLVRPLLSWATRAETHAYCTEHGVEYRIDPMNEDVRFTRVRIRKELIPKLAEYNPRIIETLSRTAGMLAGLETAHDPATEESPAVSQLQTLAQPDLYRSIRAWLKLHRGHLRRLEVKHIESIGRLIHSRKSGRTAELPGGERVVKQNGRLVFVHRRAGDSDKG